MNKILVTGSLAYDHIMSFPDQFKNHLLADKVHMINVSFTVDSFERHYGGTAGNIAYNLHLLGIIPRVLATAGGNFGEYRTRLEEWGIDVTDIHICEDQEMAQAYIVTDRDDNQITAFHPGAMNFAHHASIHDVIKKSLERPEWVVIAPNGKEGMQKYSEECFNAKIPYLLDPGQSIPAFSRTELTDMIRHAKMIIVNDYEMELIKKETSLELEDIMQSVETVIITKGREGSVIYTQAGIEQIPVAMPIKVVDPTGCGDAYRAGILYGLLNHLDWAKTGRIAALAATYKIEAFGTQNHSYTLPEFKVRFEEAFGESL